MTSGMRNNAIDLDTTKKKNIIVCGTEINPNPAAEITWALILGPNKATMFIQLMPLFSVTLAIIIFNENFALYHFAGATFIVSGIYLSNKKIND